MKIIQSLNDIEFLKATRRIPLPMIQYIEKEFLDRFEASNSEEELFAFRLPMNEAMILLEKDDDVLAEINHPFDLEYVERIKEGDISFYRIAIRFDPEIRVYYSLVGTYDDETEEWLNEQARYDERGGYYF